MMGEHTPDRTAEELPEPGPIRVLVVDDQRLMSRALEMFISEADDLESVGTAEDGLQALDRIGTRRPDVVLMDMEMPRMDGVEAIRVVHGGGSILSPTVTRDLIAEVRDTEEVPPHGASDTMPPLIEAITEREQAVLDLLAQGLSNVEMSQQLYVSEATVKSHMRSLMRKLGVRDRVQVLIDATRRGLISL